MKRKSLLALILALSILSGIMTVFAVEPEYTVTLISESYDEGKDEHTFTYLVECTGAPGISNILFEMNGNCNPDVHDDVIVAAGYTSGVAATYEIKTTLDPHHNVYGIKFEFADSVDDGESSTIWFTLKGEWVPDGTIPVHGKSGGVLWMQEDVEGPDCLDEEEGRVIIEKIVEIGKSSPYTNDFVFEFIGDITGTIGDGEDITVDLPPGTYTVTELNGGWMTSIEIIDPDGESYSSGVTTTIDLDAGETIIVTYTNSAPENVIPETPYGTIATIFVMMAAMYLLRNRVAPILE
jgi:hypothetical protein